MRNAFPGLGSLALVTFAVLLVARAGGEEAVSARAARLHHEAIVVDAHLDVPWALHRSWADLGRQGATDHVDVPRMIEGGLTAPFFAIYVPPSYAQRGTAASEALVMADEVARTVAANPRLTLATGVAGIREAKAAGRIAVMQGIEGGHVIQNSLPLLRVFQRLGVRYLTLTHTSSHDWAGSSGPFWRPDFDAADPAHHKGLTEFGRHVVREMNRLGVAVDVSHASDETLRDALAVSRAPVFASHSSCRALTDIPRNLTDDQIRQIAGRGGVVMVNIGSVFVSQPALDQLNAFRARIRPQYEALARQYADDPVRREEEENKLFAPMPPVRATLALVVDHIEHVMRLAPGAAGIGTDFDGIDETPVGLEDASRYPAITEELLRRGHTEEEVRGVLGESFLRFLGRVEETARSLSPEPPDTAELRP